MRRLWDICAVLAFGALVFVFAKILLLMFQ
jgi:hypothetical protein